MASMSGAVTAAATAIPTTTPAQITGLYDTVYAYNAVAPFDAVKLPTVATAKPA